MASQRIILAADKLTLDQVLALMPKVGKRLYAVKVHNLLDQHGTGIIQQLHEAGALRVWADVKLLDIPETVGLRARAYTEAGADIISIHASGEIDMMMAAVKSGITILAITVLTSLSEEQAHLNHGQPAKAAALYYARLAKLAGVHGVVCSPKEVGLLAKRPELKGLELVTPGIRSAGVDAHDQKRVDTPSAAIKAGATRLVIGRQIADAQDPEAEIELIEEEIARALTESGEA